MIVFLFTPKQYRGSFNVYVCQLLFHIQYHFSCFISRYSSNSHFGLISSWDITSLLCITLSMDGIKSLSNVNSN